MKCTGNRIYTTYAYYDASAPADGALGELETVSYSDATSDVTFKYTRLGQPASIADVLGTRSFTYNSNLQRSKETFGASGPLSGKVITTDLEDTVSYQPPGAPFPQLFKFDRLESVEVGTSGDPDADYRAAYDYSGDSGRMTKVTAGPGLPAGGIAYTYWTGGGGAAAGLVDKIEYKCQRAGKTSQDGAGENQPLEENAVRGDSLCSQQLAAGGCAGESPQDGQDSLHSDVTSAGLVAAADRTGAGRGPGDGRPLRPRRGGPAKPAKPAHRVGGPA